MIRSEGRTAYRRILAAVDAFADDALNRDLNRSILELASSQATRCGAELHVVHAFGPLGAVPFGPDGDPATYAKAVADLHRGRLDALLTAFPIGDEGVHLEEGRAGEVIPAIARRLDVDLIVMGTVGRVGIPGFFIGNTAETTLDEVDCDVLAIKPPGFVTPVRLPDPT
jgi:universal stress protein E